MDRCGEYKINNLYTLVYTFVIAIVSCKTFLVHFVHLMLLVLYSVEIKNNPGSLALVHLTRLTVSLRGVIKTKQSYWIVSIVCEQNVR